MRQKIVLFITVVMGAFTALSAQKALSLEAIYSGALSPKNPIGFRFMNDGKHYTVFKSDSQGTRVVQYSTTTQRQTQVCFNGEALPNRISFSGYSFSPDEKKLLLVTEVKKIFRHSKRARYYLYDRATKALSPVADRSIREPTFSPDGKKLAFVCENNLYIKDLETGKTTQITTDGEKNHIINGVTDWVYEEEFSYVRAFDWSPDSQSIAYLKFDESRVEQMCIPVYGPESQSHPARLTYKYPKAGEANARVTAYCYSAADGKTAAVDLSAYKDYYIPKIQWTAQADQFALFIANRHQNKVDFLRVNRRDNRVEKILTETDPKYIETDDLYVYFLRDNSFVWQSERDGYRHLYYYAADGRLKNRITKGNYVVTQVYGVDESRKNVYYQSTQDGSINRALYAVGLNGKRARKLNRKIGLNDAYFSGNFKYYIHVYSTGNSPEVYSLNEGKTGKRIRVLEDNRDLVDRLKPYGLSKVTYFSIPRPGGTELNAWMIKPPDFDASKTYPLFIYVYGGPNSQTVLNAWGTADLWLEMLAQRGFIVAAIDNRGTGGKGVDFKKQTYLQLGKYETQDQIYAARFLGKKPFIDAERIGIFGWSYGAFLASLCITQGADTFRSAIAVAPVTNWRYYDSIYTERYMRTPQENPRGYDDNSPIHYVEKLKGDYLLIHGTKDDNVHFQNTLEMDEALVQADKTFDMQVYKDRDHSLRGGNTTLHLYHKMTRFLMQHLKYVNDKL